MSIENKKKAKQKHASVNIVISPKNVFKKLLYIIFFLLIANITVLIMKYHFKHEFCHGLVPMFDFDAEMNIPTFYSSFALLFSSALLAIIALCHKKSGTSYWLWVGLSIVFLFLSIDEFTSIHECLGEPSERLLKSSGLLKSSRILFYAWIIPYGIALTAFGIVYLKFLLNLPRKTMLLFIASGIVFVSGAIGFETLSGIQEKLYGANSTYALLYTLEELFEMLGVAIFIYALLDYICGQFEHFSITVKKKELN